MARPKKNLVEDNSTENVENIEEVAVIGGDDCEVAVKSKAEVENEELRKQLADLQAQMAMMAQMISGQSVASSRPVAVSRTIPFYNMTKSTLILKGNIYHQFDKQFDMQGIPENEARQIIQNMPKSTRDGSFYIADNQFVQENELSAIYETILNVDQMKNLLSKDSKYVLDVYMNASEGQKKIILDMIVDKRLNGQPVDANILIELGKLSGRDFMSIEPLTKE